MRQVNQRSSWHLLGIPNLSTSKMLTFGWTIEWENERKNDHSVAEMIISHSLRRLEISTLKQSPATWPRSTQASYKIYKNHRSPYHQYSSRFIPHRKSLMSSKLNQRKLGLFDLHLLLQSVHSSSSSCYYYIYAEWGALSYLPSLQQCILPHTSITHMLLLWPLILNFLFPGGIIWQILASLIRIYRCRFE